MADLRQANQPMTTVATTFAPMVTAASLPDQPVAASSIVPVSHAAVESDLRYAADLVSPAPQLAGQAKKPGWSKGRRREERDENAPRPPLTGYIRFLNEHREKMRKEQPNVPFAEVTKILGARWTELPNEEKERYRTEAQHDKITYAKELEAYKRTEAYSAFVQKKALIQKQQRDGRIEAPGFNMPVFTEEFLDYNKGKDLELQALRRANAEAEDKNNLLSEHISHLQKVFTALEGEMDQRKEANTLLESKLQLLRETIIMKFRDCPLPETGLIATPTTVDQYITKINNMLLNPMTVRNEAFLQRIKDITASVDLDGIFSGVSRDALGHSPP